MRIRPTAWVDRTPICPRRDT